MDGNHFANGAAGRRVLNAIGRFRRTTPWRLAQDFSRARRLRRHDPTPRAHVGRPERLVVALTTVPERAAFIRPALRSLLDQTCPADRILLAWPTRSRLSGTPYPPPPPLPPGVELLPCEDIGPATKLLPALLAEPTAAIIVADDDVIYPVDFLETLLHAHRLHPATALGWRGWRLRAQTDGRDLLHIFATAVSTPTTVDVLLGTWGYLVPSGALDAGVHEFHGWPPEVRWVDDIWISGHLARCGIPRRIVPARGLPIETEASNIAALTYGANRSGRNDRIAIEAFAAWW